MRVSKRKRRDKYCINLIDTYYLSIELVEVLIFLSLLVSIFAFIKL